MKESIFLDQIRDIFAILDRGIYGLISIFYDTIEQLATTTIISSSSINDIATKIYGLLAVFMIFKISFSLINFLVNPDMISDKAKGGGTLIKNIIITFVLIISVPFCFDMLYRAQKVIISDGIIQKYILGGNTEEAGYTISMSDECNMAAATNKVGDYIGLMAFKPFFQLSEDKDATDFESIKDKYCSANIGTAEGKASVSNLLKNRDVYDAPHGISFDHYYVVEYTIFLSSIIGIVIALLFLTFCFDIAVRTIKLYFLEIIAPVPIISYIDPDSSKNGMFKKWLKEVFNTWLSLFIRLAAIYFAIYIIGMLANMDIPGNNLWIKLLIIIGALIFAKQLPKMIEDILGIKVGKDFTMNPFKKLGNEMFGAKQISGLGASALGLGLGAASNLYARNATNKKFEKKHSDEYDNLIREKALNDRNNELRNAKNNAEVMQAEAKYKARQNAINNKDYAALGLVRNRREYMRQGVRDEKKSIMNKYAATETIASAVRGAIHGYGAGTKGTLSPGSIAQAAAQGATEASKIRSYNDNYSLGNRIMDKVTDIADVKNSSGTSSLAGEQIKMLTKQLESVTQALDMKRMQISKLDSAAIMHNTKTGDINMRETYDGADREIANQLVREYNELRNTMESVKSEIKKQTDLKEQKRPSSGGK